MIVFVENCARFKRKSELHIKKDNGALKKSQKLKKKYLGVETKISQPIVCTFFGTWLNVWVVINNYIIEGGFYIRVQAPKQQIIKIAGFALFKFVTWISWCLLREPKITNQDVNIKYGTNTLAY